MASEPWTPDTPCPHETMMCGPEGNWRCRDCGEATGPVAGLATANPIAPDALDHVTDAEQHVIGPKDDDA